MNFGRDFKFRVYECLKLGVLNFEYDIEILRLFLFFKY